jgi:hypothetical protein
MLWEPRGSPGTIPLSCHMIILTGDRIMGYRKDPLRRIDGIRLRLGDPAEKLQNQMTVPSISRADLSA